MPFHRILGLGASSLLLSCAVLHADSIATNVIAQTSAPTVNISEYNTLDGTGPGEIRTSSQHSAVTAPDGTVFSNDARASASVAGLSLYVQQDSGGPIPNINTSPNFTMAQASFQIIFDQLPQSVAYISCTLTANGHGITGDATTHAQAMIGCGVLNDLGGRANIDLNGGLQTASSGFGITQSIGAFRTAQIDLFANLSVTASNSSQQTGTIDYWGTFTPVVTAYDSSFNSLGSIPLPTAETPEPGSLLLFGTGIVGTLGAMRRKLKK